MNRIIQLEDIAVSLEKAQKLNNKTPSALAWVFNKWKHTPEFELTPVEKLNPDTDKAALISVKISNGRWEMWNSDIFVSMEQIQELIKKKEFYYAPLKNSKAI